MANRSQVLYWSCQCAGWGIYGFIQSVAAVIYLNLSWLSAIAQVCLLYGLGLGFTHALRAVMKRRQWLSLRAVPFILRILAAVVVMGIIMGAITQLTDFKALQDPGRIDQVRWGWGPGTVLALNVVNWSVLFLFWIGLYRLAVGIRGYKSSELKQSELARALQSAELRLLKSQLNPHFMFNALNVVRSLIAEDPKRAQGAVTQLANTLRYTLSSSQGELVTLDHELSMVKDYLDIESLRFEDRLSVRCDVSAGARSVRIPVMMLQTVVENAVKHGIAALPEGGVLSIDGDVRDGALVLKVENPRPTTGCTTRGEGIGLRNAAERMRLLFGEQATLDADFSQPAMATIRIRIPQGA